MAAQDWYEGDPYNPSDYWNRQAQEGTGGTGGAGAPSDPAAYQNPEGYQDIAYWQARGYDTNDMFRPDGSMQTGWTRTAKGYEYNPTVARPNDDSPPPPTSTAPPKTIPIDAPFGPHAPGTGAFSAQPFYTAPGYINPGAFDAGPAFSFRDFVAPDPNSLKNDPSFQFRFGQGIKALEADRAGRGTFRSGATGKALEDYGQNAASQEYGNIWNRASQEYDTNRNNSFGNWAAQYGQRKDTYGFGAENANRQNTFNQTNAKDSWADLFGQWSKTGDWLTQMSQDPG